MTETILYERKKPSWEKIPPPRDSFEVDENAFAVADATERAFLYTEFLYDCKAITIRNARTTRTLLAHLSCTSDLPGAAEAWAAAVTTSDPEDPIEVNIATGSQYNPDNDIDEPAYDEPELIFYSTGTIKAALQVALARYSNITFEIDTTPSQKPRAIAVELANGKHYEVDADEKPQGDITSRGAIIDSYFIEPSLNES